MKLSIFISAKLKKITSLLLIITSSIMVYSQENYKVIKRNSAGTATLITIEDNENVTKNNFFNIFKSELKLSSNDRLILNKISKPDMLGYINYKYYQTYKNLTVSGGEYILHEKAGKIISANGNLVSNINIDINPSINSDSAIKIAMKEIGLSKYRWQDNTQEQTLKKKSNNLKATYYPKPELVINSIEDKNNTKKILLCWRFNIAGASLDKAWTVFIDANTGNLVSKISLIAKDIDGIGQTYYNGNQNINCVFNADKGLYLLEEYQRGSLSNQQIFTYTANNDSLPPNGTVWNSMQKIGSNLNTFAGDKAANSVHWGIENAYDFYTLFKRNSFDDKGTYILNLVHYSNNYNNAFWSNYDTVMCYGDGDHVLFDYVVSLDVAGHEFSHAITFNTAELEYQGESGALNESFSDILGTGIEWQVLGSKSNWYIGENVLLKEPYYLRSMNNPKLGWQPQPNTYNGDYWINTDGCVPSESNDHCGVHINSGVQNYWFYLLTNGGSGVNDKGTSFSVKGIGMSDALNIAYRNLTTYLMSTSDYNDAMIGSIQAAKDYWGSNSQQVQSVKDAWCAVGVGSCGKSSLSNYSISNKITLYPNPFSLQTTIQTEQYLNNASLTICNSLGQVVKQIDNLNGKKFTFNRDNLTSGIYFIRLSVDNILVSNDKLIINDY